MIISKQQKSKHKQKGIVLLGLVFFIFLTISSYYFSSVSLVEVQLDKAEKTQAVLKRAKQALLDYAVVNWNMAGKSGNIGKLPCPDYNNNGASGEQDGSCGTAYANAIGYFPWRTLGIDVTKDSSGSCLLYAVSPAYKNSPAAALNPDSYGQFRIVDVAGVTVQGINPGDRPVVVIIAPESALSGQAREDNPGSACGSYYSDVIPDLLAAYLDNNGTTNNAAIDPATNNVIESFVQQYANSDGGNNPLNDRLITITHAEFWQTMNRTLISSVFNDRMEELTEAIALCLAAYGNNNGKHLPMPAALDLNGGEYRRNADYDDSGDFTAGFAGRLPYNVSNANVVLTSPTIPSDPPAAGNNGVLFKNSVCNGIDLTVGTYNNINFKDDSGDDLGEFFDLWQNWKDHFFYAVSKAYNPTAAATSCSDGCVEIAAIPAKEYVGIVFFAGQKRGGQPRYAPPFEGDDKSEISNYLENGNDLHFPDNTGDKVYTAVDPVISNDVMYCIKDDMSVVKC